MKVAAQNNMNVKSVEEIMRGCNLLSTHNLNNPTGTNDPFYEPYTFYSTLCSNVNTYYVYDHLGNTRITYTPTVMPDGLHYTLNGVYDYYPYGKILREYVQGTQEKYLTTHHQRDEETGLDYRGARFYDCDIARFLSLDPLAVKYHSYSAYCYVAGDPILLIDPDGKDIIFAIDREAARKNGHMGVLVGNMTSGWSYVSINGTGGGKEKPWGNNTNPDKGTVIKDKQGNIITDPMQAVIMANNINPTEEHSYDAFVQVITSETEDGLALGAAIEKANCETYGIAFNGNSCIDPAQAAFKAIVNSRQNNNKSNVYGNYDLSPNVWFNNLMEYIEQENSDIEDKSQKIKVEKPKAKQESNNEKCDDENK